MQKILKVITVTTFITIFSINLSPTSNAAPTKKVAEVVCKKTSAKAHSVKNIIPPEVKPPFKNKTFTLTTNCGDIVIEANAKSAPITVVALAALAKGGFFNKTFCHRLTTNNIFVLQCGDPTGTGLGGPNFSYRDENLPQAVESNYPAGVVAMANSGANTNGSQFFIVYDDNSRLGANYTLWGRVTKGLDIVKTIAALGSNNQNGVGDGAPNQAITIERAVSR